ncbi:uncharacterized protein VTP21DRAFT_11523 [Calcarisporiella thermophila]|uniref:uncharacterized protein n=1 Tax=Calcarisporiella thermophila TaxID=911321 RepID=UPI0037426049
MSTVFLLRSRGEVARANRELTREPQEKFWMKCCATGRYSGGSFSPRTRKQRDWILQTIIAAMSEASWLDYLPRHAIFDPTHAEVSLLQKLSIPFVDEDFDDEEDWSGRQCLAVRENELFAAIGSEIRALNLIEFRYAFRKAWERDRCENMDWINDISYKKLQTDGITFTIRSLSFNRGGKLLAVAGDREVAVVVLPHTRAKNGIIECRTYSVGSYYHAAGGSSRIVKHYWHPLSETRSHLIILTHRGVIRLYDVAKDIEEPELTVRVPVRDRAVSFCMGEGSGWGPFTAYVLTEGGDIFAVCPIVPERSICARAHLENLNTLINSSLQQLDTLFDENKAQISEEEYAYRSQQYTLQERWIKDTLASAASTETQLRLSPPARLTPMPQQIEVQGMVRGRKQADKACDLAYITGNPVGVIVVAFAGTLHALIELGIEPTWRADSSGAIGERKTCSLCLYETIRFGEGGDRMRLISHWRDAVYCLSSKGVHAVFLKWVAELRNIKDKEDARGSEEGGDAAINMDKEIAKFIDAGQTSDVVHVVRIAEQMSECVNMAGLVELDDVSLGRALLSLTTASRFVGIELDPVHTPPASPKLSSAVADQLAQAASENRIQLDIDEKDVCNLEEKRYDPLLPLPPFKPPACLVRNHGLPRRPRIVCNTKLSTDTIPLFKREVASFRDEIRALTLAGLEIQKRLELQQRELKRQLEHLSTLAAASKSQKTKQRLEKAMEHQQKLRVRMNTLLQILIDNHGDGGVRSVERGYFEELEKMKHRVLGSPHPNERDKLLLKGGKVWGLEGILMKKEGEERRVEEGFERKIQRLRQDFDATLKQYAEACRHKKERPQPLKLGETELVEVEQKLGQQAKRIGEMRRALEELDTRFRANGKATLGF